jgi:hypothetical protein
MGFWVVVAAVDFELLLSCEFTTMAVVAAAAIRINTVKIFRFIVHDFLVTTLLMQKQSH